MTKDTINKVFQKAFQSNIWKIEVDAYQPLLAIETRDPSSTMPQFYVIDAQGNDIMQPQALPEKEWTLDSIQKGHLIIKSVGEHTPVREGIQVIRAEDNKIIYLSHEHVLIDVFKDTILARHRNIASGEQLQIDLCTGQTAPLLVGSNLPLASNAVLYPLPYPKTPSFLQQAGVEGPLWLNKVGENFFWCYHQKTKGGFNLILTLSDLNHILDQKVILADIEKMVPQPYFQSGNQIFFMSSNKREIVSYLV